PHSRRGQPRLQRHPNRRADSKPSLAGERGRRVKMVATSSLRQRTPGETERAVVAQVSVRFYLTRTQPYARWCQAGSGIPPMGEKLQQVGDCRSLVAQLLFRSLHLVAAEVVDVQI